MFNKTFIRKYCLWIIVILLIFSTLASTLYHANAETTRTGAWLDSVEFSVVESANAVSNIRDGDIDIFTSGLSSSFYNQNIQNDPTLDISTDNGQYYELTLNPAVFYNTNYINPFSVDEIREAMNWLIDRDYLNQSVYNGIALNKFFPIMTGQVDYQRYAAKVADLENTYAYDPTLAETVITTEMASLDAYKAGGIWHYNGEPITIILLIRNDSDSTRIPIGDYVADQLESVGFLTERLYLSSSETVQIWFVGDPADGQWHIYTAAWPHTAIDRDEGDSFQFFLSPDSPYGGIQLWQSYDPSQEFQEKMNKLAGKVYADLAERDALFEYCLEESMKFAVRIWLFDGNNFTPRRSTVSVANNIAAGVDGNTLWPFTARFLESEGGNLKIGQADLFVTPWNPVAGSNWDDLSNWAFDSSPIFGTQNHGLINDPHTGLPLPQRIESATVTAQTGLPITSTEPWVTLNFEDVIEVPDDAWAEWDASEQNFIPTSVIYPEGTTALIKSVVTYPADLFTTVTWHDGSPLTIGDFIYNIILGEDRSDPSSSIYDPDSYDYSYDSIFNESTVIGIRITNQDPLTIETYHNYVELDAELLVYPWWPNRAYGPAPWHTTALAAVAEEAGELAFSESKADSLGIPWTNFLHGDTLGILSTHLSDLNTTDYIPYTNTLNDYITTGEADLRWANLVNWYLDRGHFWVGNGPFYVDEYDWNAQTLTLTRFEDFPDPSDKWERFQEGSIHALAIDYPYGAPGSTFVILGHYYPPSTEAAVYINEILVGTVMTDANGEFALTLTMDPGSEFGLYIITISVDGQTQRAQSNSVTIWLDDLKPLREHDPIEDNITAPLIEPIINSIYLPMINR